MRADGTRAAIAERFVEVLGIDQIVTEQRFTSLGERAVSDDRFAVLDANGRCGRSRLQGVAGLEVAALDDRWVNFPYSSIIFGAIDVARTVGFAFVDERRYCIAFPFTVTDDAIAIQSNGRRRNRQRQKNINTPTTKALTTGSNDETTRRPDTEPESAIPESGNHPTCRSIKHDRLKITVLRSAAHNRIPTGKRSRDKKEGEIETGKLKSEKRKDGEIQSM